MPNDTTPKDSGGGVGNFLKQLIRQIEVTVVKNGITRFSNAWSFNSNLKIKLRVKCVDFMPHLQRDDLTVLT